MGHGRKKYISSVCQDVNSESFPNHQRSTTVCAYLFRQITSVGVDGSDTAVCGLFGVEVGPLNGAVLDCAFDCPLDASSAATSATEAFDAFDAFFLAIAGLELLVIGRRGVMVVRSRSDQPCGLSSRWRAKFFLRFPPHMSTDGIPEEILN